MGCKTLNICYMIHTFSHNLILLSTAMSYQYDLIIILQFEGEDRIGNKIICFGKLHQ